LAFNFAPKLQGRVAAGAIAEHYLNVVHGIEIVAFTSSIGSVTMADNVTADHESVMQLYATISRDMVDANEVRCPDEKCTAAMRQLILSSKEKSDSIGGTVTCVLRNVPMGLGEPCFDKLEAQLAHAMLSIPATKGFEIGSGFAGTTMAGSLHNDAWVKADESDRLRTKTNYSGGIQGGISNGEMIYFRVAFKPAATIGQAQTTVQYDGSEGILEARGRHDPCVVPRAIPIVEAMAAIVLME
jgi:chorismate synthase